jgi:hypothetical protein
MKRSGIIVVTLLTALAVAVPAYAKRTPTTPIDVAFEASPMWVHEAADVVTFTMEITNKSNDPIDLTIDYANGTFDTTVPARGSFGPADLYTVDVGEAIGDADVLGVATVSWDSGSVEAVAASTVDPTPPCDFSYTGEGPGGLIGTASLDIEFACIWTPPENGTWRVAMLPAAKRPTGASWTVRDHVPGNWCGSAAARWRPGDGPVTGTVYLPGPEGLHGDGVCYDGGIGGAGWFPIGNPDSFYLVADDEVTVTWLG